MKATMSEISCNDACEDQECPILKAAGDYKYVPIIDFRCAYVTQFLINTN